MIDVWLLFNLLKPFVDIIVQTHIETLRTDKEERDINHHGKTIKVGAGNDGIITVSPVDNKDDKRYVSQTLLGL